MRTELDDVATAIAGMDRCQVQEELLHFQGSLKLDFTIAYLDTLSLERLRHILLAAKAHQRYDI